MSTLFVQYNSNCAAFENLPVLSKVLLFYIGGIVLPLVVFLPKKNEVAVMDPTTGLSVVTNDQTIFSISASLRTPAAQVSAMVSLAYWAITDLAFCSTWKGFYAMEVTAFVLIVLVIFVNAEDIPNPKTADEIFQHRMAIGHKVFAAAMFIYLEVIGALIVAYNLTGSAAFEITIFAFQSFWLVALTCTERKYGTWVNATDLSEYFYVTLSLALIAAIQRASIVPF